MNEPIVFVVVTPTTSGRMTEFSTLNPFSDFGIWRPRVSRVPTSVTVIVVDDGKEPIKEPTKEPEPVKTEPVTSEEQRSVEAELFERTMALFKEFCNRQK